MRVAKPQATPMISSFRLQQNVFVVVQNLKFYRFFIGALKYIFITCPKLSYIVNKVFQYMYNPHEYH